MFVAQPEDFADSFAVFPAVQLGFEFGDALARGAVPVLVAWLDLPGEEWAAASRASFERMRPKLWLAGHS